MKAILDGCIRLIERGVAKPDDRRGTRIRKVSNVVTAAAFALLFLLLVAPLHLLNGATEAAWVYAAMGVGFLLCITVFLFGLKDNNLFIAATCLTGSVGVIAACVALGGALSSTGGYLWFIVVVVALLTSGVPPRAQVAGSLAISACAAAILLVDPYLPKPQLTSGAESTILAVTFFATFGYVVAVLYFTVAQSRSLYRRLREESRKSESLLLNILPNDVAAILKVDQRTIAEHFEGVSVLFADVVGFTPMTERMTPTDLVALLNEVFTCFDELVERHGLEKIKTIGDCYMVASGVPRARPDHAKVLVQMALEMRELMGTRTFAGRRLLFRIGVNSGPVVAGVIGRKKFAYDLWGDAVNTASRMESHGKPGEIQITRSTYERVGERFVCEPLGSIEIKGKGLMDAWRVVGPR